MRPAVAWSNVAVEIFSLDVAEFGAAVRIMSFDGAQSTVAIGSANFPIA
jgi:hypothetical protein